jgi:hypothetical protein
MSGKVKWGLCALTALALLAAGTAIAAKFVLGNVVVVADGGFHPNALPHKSFAPIVIRGHATIATKNGATPPPLKTILLLLDRNGRLETRGLPACDPSKVANKTVAGARGVCRRAIVGTGSAKAILTLPGQAPIPATSPLTFFNGPRQGGNATVVIHAYTTTPTPTTYVAVTTIAKVRMGRFGYRVSTDVPSIAGGYGSLTAGSLAVHRVYTYRGRRRSYTSARCADGLLEVHGKLTFADGTIIAGTVFKPCWTRG